MFDSPISRDVHRLLIQNKNVATRLSWRIVAHVSSLAVASFGADSRRFVYRFARSLPIMRCEARTLMIK